MNFLRAVATVGGLTMVSRVAGFVRDVLTAAILGAGPAADAFFVALKLPNLFRRLFAEGAFSVAFVPLFSARLASDGRRAAIAFGGEALSVMLAVLLPLTVAMITAMPWAMVVLAPGFADEPARFQLAVDLARLTFPYLALVSVVALLGGVLNALDRFGPFAAAPIAFNLTLIAGLITAHLGGLDPASALAVAVTLSGVVQLGYLAWACRGSHALPRLAWPRLTPGVRRLLRLMAPGAFGAGVMQINLFVDIVLASLLGTGAISYLYYADRLYQLPLGVIGIAIGTALLPVLSRRVEAGDEAGVRAYLSRGLEYSLVLGVPAAVALVAVGTPIVGVLFERGAFGATETVATAAAAAAYALGIPAYVIVKVLSTAYFARQDTAGPVKVAAVVTVLNAALGLALIQVIGHVGIALATGVTAWLNVALLARGLARRGRLALDHQLRRRAPRIAAAAAAMGVVLVGLAAVLAPGFAGGSVLKIAALAVLVGGGVAVYFGLAQRLGAVDLADLRGLARRPAAAAGSSGGEGP